MTARDTNERCTEPIFKKEMFQITKSNADADGELVVPQTGN